MIAIHRKISILGLIAVLVLGPVGNSAALVASCPTEACCCLAAGSKILRHHGIAAMPSTDTCAPMPQAPSCHFKPVQPKTELALSPRLKISSNHDSVSLGPLNSRLPRQQRFETRTPIMEDERIRAPLVPIYLLTLTIRC